MLSQQAKDLFAKLDMEYQPVASKFSYVKLPMLVCIPSYQHSREGQYAMCILHLLRCVILLLISCYVLPKQDRQTFLCVLPATFLVICGNQKVRVS